MSPNQVVGVQVLSTSTVSLLITPTTVKRVVAQVYYTLVDRNPLTPLLRFFLDLSYKLFLHCYAAVGKDSTDVASRGPSATAELLVYNLQATEPRASFPETSLLRDRAKPPKCHAATQTGTRSTQTMTEACPLFALPGARVVT